VQDSKITVRNAFLTAKICTKFIFGLGSAPDPKTPRWEGNTPPIPCPLDAYGISFSAPCCHCLK